MLKKGLLFFFVLTFFSMLYGIDSGKFERKARLGDTAAQYILGKSYFEKGNYRKAFYWYEKAAEGKNEDAMWALAHLYEEGKGVKKSHEKALFWEKKAFNRSRVVKKLLSLAKSGDANSAYQLGFMYETGIKFLKNYKKAFLWYEKAASKDLAKAIYKLGIFYYNGLYGKKDLPMIHI